MSQPSTPRTLSSSESEVDTDSTKKMPRKTPLKVKTPPAPRSVKKRALEDAAAEMSTPKTKKARVQKRNVLLWNHFETTKDPNVVICIIMPPVSKGFGTQMGPLQA